MNKFSTIVFVSALLALPSAAMAMDVICPPLARDGIADLAAAYTQKTGIPVTVKAVVMGKIMDDIKAGPVDVILLPSILMEKLQTDQGLQAGSRQKLGRMEIGLAVRPGMPHPDISTVEKFASALKKAAAVAYTQPGPPRYSMEAGIIDQMLHRPEFSGVHLMPITTDSGITALAKGNADMALQATSAIVSRKDVELVGALPPELGAHIDLDVASAPKAADAKAALDFIHYITRQEAAENWKRFGVNR